MSLFLLEIGCEEIPARMLAGGIDELLSALIERLESEGLRAEGPHRKLAGPRRLAVLVGGVAPRQPDRSERLVGPPADKAFDGDGKPTRAAIGFAQKLGVDPMALERTQTPKGICIAGTRHIKGQDALEVLARLVPEVVLAQSFPKTMRWGSGEHRYVRAIRNIVALLDDTIVPIEICGVRSGRTSFGHRFLGAQRVDIGHAADYEAALAQEHVVADAAGRSEAIRHRLEALARGFGATVEDDPALREEVVYFIEEPHVVLGRFAEDYLELPHEVLVTSMKHHQKGFPMWKEEGRTLAPAFAAVANVPDREGHIARGFERVLNARLADARFFWSEDRKTALAERVAKLERVTFHEKLGSYGQKTRRLEDLAPAVAHALGAGSEVERDARAAAGLAKADLSTGMVGEFAELQGIVGGLYLREEGAADGVWRGVYQHYRPLSMDGELPLAPSAIAVSLGDKLDTLTGCFGAGLNPSGTRDPFGLRRAAQGVVRILLAHDLEVDLKPLVGLAAELHARHPGAGEAASGAVDALAVYLVERLEFLLKSQGHRIDTIRAVLAVRPLEVQDAARRVRDLAACREQPGFDETFTVFKRVANIAGTRGGHEFDHSLLREPAETLLATRLDAARAQVHQAISRRDYPAALEGLRQIALPLHQFFDEVRVLDADPALSENRKRLLRAIGSLVAPIGDLSQLQVEQGKSNS